MTYIIARWSIHAPRGRLPIEHALLKTKVPCTLPPSDTNKGTRREGGKSKTIQDRALEQRETCVQETPTLRYGLHPTNQRARRQSSQTFARRSHFDMSKHSTAPPRRGRGTRITHIDQASCACSHSDHPTRCPIELPTQAGWHYPCTRGRLPIEHALLKTMVPCTLP